MGKWVVDVRFCCMICNFKSNKGKLFQYHECYKRSALKDKWSVDPGFRCHKCNFQTFDLDLFGGHDCIKKSLIILQGSSDDQAEDLDSSYEIGSGRKKHMCSICSKTFKDPQLLQDHINVIHRQLYQYECEFCLAKLGYKRNFKRHLQSCKGQSTPRFESMPPKADVKRRYQCDLCNMNNFENEESLQKHQTSLCLNVKVKKEPESKLQHQNDSGDNDGVCLPFKITYKNNKVHKTHRTCMDCGNNFRDFQRYEDHVNSVHKGLKCHKCERCQKDFGYKCSLQKHYKLCKANIVPIQID